MTPHVQILENEFKILTLEGIVNRLIYHLTGDNFEKEIKIIEKNAFRTLRKKYPEAGIVMNNEVK